MANAAVQLYLTIAQALSRPINTAIVDSGTQDYVTGLTSEQMARAVYEVGVLGQSTTQQQWSRGLVLVARENLLADVAQGADVAASSAQADANAAMATATTAAAEAALALAAASSVHATLRASGMSAVNVASGAGEPTAIAWPGAALQGTPLSTSGFALSGGDLDVTPEGVYDYTISGVFTTGLALAGVFRFALAVHDGTVETDRTVHAVQLGVLGGAPGGLAASGRVVVPSGGALLQLFAGHTAGLGTSCTFSSLRMQVHRVSA